MVNEKEKSSKRNFKSRQGSQRASLPKDGESLVDHQKNDKRR